MGSNVLRYHDRATQDEAEQQQKLSDDSLEEATSFHDKFAEAHFLESSTLEFEEFPPFVDTAGDIDEAMLLKWDLTPTPQEDDEMSSISPPPTTNVSGGEINDSSEEALWTQPFVQDAENSRNAVLENGSGNSSDHRANNDGGEIDSGDEEALWTTPTAE